MLLMINELPIVESSEVLGEAISQSDFQVWLLACVLIVRWLCSESRKVLVTLNVKGRPIRPRSKRIDQGFHYLGLKHDISDDCLEVALFSGGSINVAL
jgi:hypothetical protein